MSTVATKDERRKKKGSHLRALHDTTESEYNGELFKTLFNSSPIGIYVVQDGKFQFVNHQFARYLGYGEDELLGKESLSFVHPEDRNMARENAVKMLKGASSPPYEFRIIDKAGETKWVLAVAISIKYQGKLATLGNFIDITERKRLEEALKRSEEFSSSLLENSPNPILVVNPDTSIKYVNPALVKLTGFTSAEVTGRKAPYPWWPEERNNAIGARLDKLIAGGSKKVGELILQKKNGERFWVAINSAPVTYEGTLKYFILNWLDITERKRIEKRWWDSMSNFFKVVNNNADGIIVTNREGIVRFVNPAAEILLR